MRLMRVVLLVMFIGLVSACSGAEVERPATSRTPESAASASPTTAAGQVIEAELQATPSPEAAVTDLPVADNAPKPTPRPGMEATFPDGVRLASGQLQLVEFFAFW